MQVRSKRRMGHGDRGSGKGGMRGDGVKGG